MTREEIDEQKGNLEDKRNYINYKEFESGFFSSLCITQKISSGKQKTMKTIKKENSS